MWHPSCCQILSLEIQVWNASIQNKDTWLDSMRQAMETPSLHWGKSPVLGPAQRRRRARCQTLREWPLTPCTIREAPAVPRHGWLQDLASVWWSKSWYLPHPPSVLGSGKNRMRQTRLAPPTFHEQLGQGLVASSEQQARSQSIGATYRLRWSQPVCCHHISFNLHCQHVPDSWGLGDWLSWSQWKSMPEHDSVNS